MNADDVGSFFSRWSRRKLEETGQRPKSEEAGNEPAQDAGAPVPGDAAQLPQEPAPLPPVETLTPESDFKPFMAPGVEPGVKQAALKQLFKDPHFNVMDGLDTYIDDYGVPDPIPSEMMKQLYQARQHLFTDEEKAEADRVDKAQADALAARLDEVAPDPEAYETASQVPEEYLPPPASPPPTEQEA